MTAMTYPNTAYGGDDDDNGLDAALERLRLPVKRDTWTLEQRLRAAKDGLEALRAVAGQPPVSAEPSGSDVPSGWWERQAEAEVLDPFEIATIEHLATLPDGLDLLGEMYGRDT